MGAFTHSLTVVSADGTRTETVEALVDTGAMYTMLPSPLVARLGWKPGWEEEFELADGRRLRFPLGEVRVRLDGQDRFTIVIVGGPDTSPLLGVFTLEAFMLGIDPVNQRLIRITGLLKKTR